MCSCAVQILLKACTMAQQPTQRKRLQPLPSLEQPPSPPVLVPPVPVLSVWFAKGKHQIAMLTNPGETHTKADLQNPDLVNLLTDDIVALVSDQTAKKNQTMVRQRTAHLGRSAQSFLVVALHDYKPIDTRTMLWDWPYMDRLPGLAELPDWFNKQKAHYTITRRVDTFDKKDKRTVQLIKQLVDQEVVAKLTPLKSFKIHFNAMARHLLVGLHMLRQAECVHYDIHKGNIGLTLPTTTSTSRNRHMLLFDFGSACAVEELGQRAKRSINWKSENIMTKSVHTLVALLVYNKENRKYTNHIYAYLMKTVVQQLGYDLDMQAVCHVLYELGLTFAANTVDKKTAIEHMLNVFASWTTSVKRAAVIDQIIQDALVKENRNSYMTGFHKVALEHNLFTFSTPKECFSWLDDSLGKVTFDQFIQQTVDSDGFPAHYYRKPAESWEPNQADQSNEPFTLGQLPEPSPPKSPKSPKSPHTPHPPHPPQPPHSPMAPPRMPASAQTTGSAGQKPVAEDAADTEESVTELEQQQQQQQQPGQAVPASQADDDTATELDEDQPFVADATVGGAAQSNDETEQDDPTVVESVHPAGQDGQAAHLYEIPDDGWCVYSSYLVAFDQKIFQMNKATNARQQAKYDLQRHALAQQFVRLLAKRILQNDNLMGILCKAIRTASTDPSTVSEVQFKTKKPDAKKEYGYRLDQEAGDDDSWVARFEEKYKYVKLGSFDPSSLTVLGSDPNVALRHCANFDMADFLHNTWKSKPGVVPRLGKFGSPMMYGDASWFVPIMNEINAGKPDLQMDFVIRKAGQTGRIDQAQNIVVIKSQDGAHFDSQVGVLVKKNPFALLGENVTSVYDEYVRAPQLRRIEMENEWDDEWDKLAAEYNRRRKEVIHMNLEDHDAQPDDRHQQQDADDANDEASHGSGHDEANHASGHGSPSEPGSPAQPVGSDSSDDMYEIRGEILDYLL